MIRGGPTFCLLKQLNTPKNDKPIYMYTYISIYIYIYYFQPMEGIRRTNHFATKRGEGPLRARAFLRDSHPPAPKAPVARTRPLRAARGFSFVRMKRAFCSSLFWSGGKTLAKPAVCLETEIGAPKWRNGFPLGFPRKPAKKWFQLQRRRQTRASRLAGLGVGMSCRASKAAWLACLPVRRDPGQPDTWPQQGSLALFLGLRGHPTSVLDRITGCDMPKQEPCSYAIMRALAEVYDVKKGHGCT